MSSYQKDVYISWDQLHQDARKLCEKIHATGKTYKGIIAIARGGLIPAGIVARELNIRHVETICIAVYE
ncbi:MAG: xanthine phosphoribosyltransferase, partial [Pseudomonadales bacterium]|nr:xanthine phosphoribosyltransferase [Pseudomonadales bacterium]